jgi:hypothetical protein
MATAGSRLDREALRQLNLYEVLQVSPKASPEVVQAAYRTLARAYHPDVNGSPHAARMMRQLNAAYRVLSDPERRSKYDAQRAHQWRARPVPAERPMRPTSTTVSTGVRNGRVVTAARGSAELPISPIKSSWRIGRLLALLLFLMVMVGTLMFAFWMIAGALEDDRYIRASGAIHVLLS